MPPPVVQVDFTRTYLEAVIRQLSQYKETAETAFAQVDDHGLHWRPGGARNSLAIQMQHLGGVLRSRWTDFLSSDGEKPDRNRAAEFEDRFLSREALTQIWSSGWEAMIATLHSLGEADLARTVHIKAQSYTVFEAIERSLAHTAYHVGQIVMTERLIAEHRSAREVQAGPA